VFFVAKPVPGTGGTLLGKLPMLVFDGAESAPMRYTQNEEEMQKALLAAIMETRSHLFFDDVKDFNNRSLLQSITAQEIGGRMLGVSRNVSRPNLFNWIGTGNNPIVGSEMERRICWIRLNAKTADIQSRVYHHPDLPGWVSENRSKIICAILTMIQYWIDVGCPEFTERSRASFEDWARKAGGVLMACGVEGFLDNRRSAGADMDETANRQFIGQWLKKFAFEKTLPAKLFEYAVGMELDIVEGNNDDQKKQRFPKRLHTLDGRAFTVDGADYMVMTTFDDEQQSGLLPVAAPGGLDPGRGADRRLGAQSHLMSGGLPRRRMIRTSPCFTSSPYCSSTEGVCLRPVRTGSGGRAAISAADLLMSGFSAFDCCLSTHARRESVDRRQSHD
jgi:hypothetical protein